MAASLAGGGTGTSLLGQEPAPFTPAVLPMYVVPADLTLDGARLALSRQAVADVRRWYGDALGGATFAVEPMVVQVSRHTFEELSADDFQAWWPLLSDELADYGLSWKTETPVKLLLLVAGAGAWAGADSENGGIEDPGQAGRVERGDLGGFVLIGDSAAAGIAAGVCPMDGIAGGTAWWCNWDTYRGTIAHELGHTWGVPHPADIAPRTGDEERPPWECDDHGDTVMQCHWNFPGDSLLPYEADHLRSLRFFREPHGREVALAERLPRARGDGVVIRRAALAESASSLAWIERAGAGGVGGAVGFPSAVEIPAGAGATWRVGRDGCGAFVAEVGRARGAGGRGELAVLVDDVPVGSVTVSGPGAQRVAWRFCDGERLDLRVTGQRRFRGVFGSARIRWGGA